jgi:hypothetical protein
MVGEQSEVRDVHRREPARYLTDEGDPMSPEVEQPGREQSAHQEHQ